MGAEILRGAGKPREVPKALAALPLHSSIALNNSSWLLFRGLTNLLIKGGLASLLVLSPNILSHFFAIWIGWEFSLYKLCVLSDFFHS